MTSIRTAARALRIPLIISATTIATGLTLVGPASALPLQPIDPVPHCPIGWTLNADGVCVRPAPVYNPFGSLDLAQETTSLNAVHVAGWAADQDAPTTSLGVRVYIDNTLAATVTANGSRTDVANSHPGYGAYHGFDVTLPASAAGHTISVTAVNVGSGSDTSLGSKTEDSISSFVGSRIRRRIAQVPRRRGR